METDCEISSALTEASLIDLEAPNDSLDEVRSSFSRQDPDEGNSEADSNLSRSKTRSDPECQSQVQELSQLSIDQILERVDDLKKIAYSLGVSEAHEMTRGKLLDIFGLNGVLKRRN